MFKRHVSRKPRHEWKRQPAATGLGPIKRRAYSRKVQVKLEDREWIDSQGYVIQPSETAAIQAAIALHTSKVSYLATYSAREKPRLDALAENRRAMRELCEINA